MSKFEDVKVGDTVLISTGVNIGWGQLKNFWVKDTVSKVTKTQFTTAQGVRAKRDSGSVIGEHAHVAKEGDSYGYNGKEVHVDQTEEMQEFKAHQQVILKSRKMTEDLYESFRDSDAYDIDPVLAVEVLQMLRSTGDYLAKEKA